MTRAETVKVGVSHVVSIHQTTDAMGYTPLISYDKGVQRARAYFHPLLLPRFQRRKILVYRVVFTLITIILAILFVMLALPLFGQ